MIKIGLTDYTPSDKIIEIRDKNQIVKAEYAISSTDILKYSLMSEHYIEISFQYNQHIAFKRSDYILWNGSKYTLREDYRPTQENKYKYNYTLKFEATEMLFQDIQFYYLNQSLKESEWRLAGNPEYFIKIAVDNANRYFGGSDFKTGTIDVVGVKDIVFNTNTNTFDALTQIAESYEAEWYMTGKTINLVKKVSFGAEIDFETEVSVLSMSRSEGENSTRYTRIVPLGSTRNLPRDYRGSSTAEGVDAVYSKRLRIPAVKGDVIDAYPNMSPEEVVEGTVIFDEVYPKRVGTIEAIETIEYTDTDEDTKEITKWNAFKIKDSGINFKKDYLLPDVELRLSFQSGDLYGFDFALNFHEEGFSENDKSQYFEIKRSEDYGKLLPNDTMKPKAGDKYVLYGFNIALVSDQYVPAGEQELFDTASAWIQKQLEDTSVYECPTVIDHFKKNEMDLEIGQRALLVHTGANMIPDSEKIIVKNIAGSGASISIPVDMIQGETYTLSYESTDMVVAEEYPRFYIWEPLNWNKLQNLGTITAKTRTFKFTQPTGRYTFSVYNHDYPQAGTINRLKLERGNKATGWIDYKNSFRSSRIMGYEKKLYNIYDATYTVGDNSTYSRLAAIEKEIKELQYAGVVYENTGSGGVYLIKQFDTTTPSDSNAYSAKASDARYFNKQTGGSVTGDTVFQRNMQVLGSAVSDVFQNSTFTAGQLGSGFQIKRDADGQSYMEIDNLMVRREAVFNRLTIAEIKSVGGTILLSLANMVISKIENKTATWKCFFDNSDGTIPNDFAVNDQVICRRFTGKNIKYYWSRVVSVGVDFIEISKSDKDGSSTPAVDDEVIQLGNRTDVNRQSAIMLSAYGSDSPSIKQYAGINSYDLTGKEVTVISPKGNKFTGAFTISTNGTTSPIYKDRDGGFQNGTTYYLNDRISYQGAYWVCVVNSTVQTPSETSLSWNKETTSQGDINNAIDNIQVGGSNLVDGSREVTVSATAGQGANLTMSVDMVKGETYTLSYESTTLVVSNDYPQFYIWKLNDWTSVQSLGNVSAKTRTFVWNKPSGKYTFTVYNHNYPQAGTINRLKLERGNKATDWNLSDADIQKDIQKVRSEYQADFKVLDNQISSKVSQTDFNTLGNRVSTTESNITQLSGSITSVVETVNNIQIGGENLLLSTKTIGSGWSYGVGTSRIANDYMDLTSISGAVPTTGYLDIASYSVKNLEPNTYYTFSMWIKGQNNTDKIATHLYPSAVVSGLNSQGNTTTLSDGYIVSNVSAEWKRIWITWKTRSDTSGNKTLLPARISNANGTIGNKIFMCGFQLEKGNKATDWSPAIKDTQTSIDNAQNTADSKNKTYYQDTIPAIPSGGHKTGDLWYKSSLVDSSGNINADTTKNIYQLQYRWNGTTWVQVNWSASKSKIEQTDNRITSIVESTDIDSFGIGRELKSMINQTNTEISLAVGKIQTGSNNLLNNSSLVTVKGITGSGVDLTMSVDMVKGETYTLSYESTSLVVSNTYPRFFIWEYFNWTKMLDLGAITAKTRTFKFTLPTGKYTFSVYNHNYPQGGTINKLKLEKGNIATNWSASKEDDLNEIGSKLTLTDNKISLASTTIELKGNTIAKAIQAQSLNVNNKAIINTDGSASFGGDTTVFNVDGSGKTANGNISWDAKGDLLVTGKFETNRNGDRINIDASTRSLKLIGFDDVVYGNLSFQNRDGQIYPMISFNNAKKSINAFLSYKSLDLIENYKHGSLSPAGLTIVYNDGPVLNPKYNCFTVQAEASGILKVIALGLPTSKKELETGQLWRDGDIIKIVL